MVVVGGIIIIIIYTMFTINQNFALPFRTLSAFMFQIKTSQTLLCSMLPINVATVLLPLDVLWQLMPSVRIMRCVVINDTPDAHIFTKYLRNST